MAKKEHGVDDWARNVAAELGGFGRASQAADAPAARKKRIKTHPRTVSTKKTTLAAYKKTTSAKARKHRKRAAQTAKRK
jgi:hypothetical protein